MSPIQLALVYGFLKFVFVVGVPDGGEGVGAPFVIFLPLVFLERGTG